MPGIKHIVAHVEGGPHDGAVLKMSAALAGRFGAADIFKTALSCGPPSTWATMCLIPGILAYLALVRGRHGCLACAGGRILPTGSERRRRKLRDSSA